MRNQAFAPALIELTAGEDSVIRMAASCSSWLQVPSTASSATRVTSGSAGRIVQEREDGCQRGNCVAGRESVDWIERIVRQKARKVWIAKGSEIGKLATGLAQEREDGCQRGNCVAGRESVDWIERVVR
jgi:hypothetical protein